MVYINDKYRFIFIENPKSGSTSILKALSESLKIQIPRTPQLQNSHQTCAQLAQLYPAKWKTYTKVTTWRDPYDRFRSSANYPRHHNLRGIKSFEHFKQHIQKPEGCQYCIPQSEFKDVDFIIKNFQEDYNTFCELVGIPSVQIKNINTNRVKMYTEEQIKELYLNFKEID